MTTYNAAAVTDAVIAFKKGITLQQGRALRDNPVAAREGATGAPYEQAAWHPYDGVSFGDGATGLLYSFAINGAASSVTTTADFEDRYEYRFILIGLATDTAAGNVTLDLKRESDGAFPSGAQDPVFAMAVAAVRYGAVVELPLCRLSNRHPIVVSPLTQPVAAIQFDLGVATKVRGARFNFPANLISGMIYLQRRLDCVT